MRLLCQRTFQCRDKGRMQVGSLPEVDCPWMQERKDPVGTFWRESSDSPSLNIIVEVAREISRRYAARLMPYAAFQVVASTSTSATVEQICPDSHTGSPRVQAL